VTLLAGTGPSLGDIARRGRLCRSTLESSGAGSASSAQSSLPAVSFRRWLSWLRRCDFVAENATRTAPAVPVCLAAGGQRE